MSIACDILLRGGAVIDGSGEPARSGDIAIAGDRIVAVGDCSKFTPTTEIDLRGLAIAPGFVDAHTHDDQLLFDDPAMSAKVSQGVTTVIVGNCGVSLAPLVRDAVPPPLTEMEGAFRFARFADYLEALDRSPAAVNAACLVGHTTLRVATMSDLDRPANETESLAMRTLCREALDSGAIGLSSGVFYPPASAAPWEEVADLVKLVGDAGGIYTAHIRDEGDDVMSAIDEACLIAAEGDVPLVVSHHKVMGAANAGRSRETLARLDAARERQPVGHDVYPYVAGASMLSWAIASSASRTIVAWSRPHPEVAGRDLAEIAEEIGLEPKDAIEKLAPGGAIYFMMDEADVQSIMAHPSAMIGSDGIANEHPHPRLWGTFTRVLGHYVRDVGLFGLEEAVRRMTSLPAQRFGLTNRGTIAPGNFADLVVFDPDTIEDVATFEDPMQPSRGIVSVYVNGEPVWDGAAPTGHRPGRALRRTTRIAAW